MLIITANGNVEKFPRGKKLLKHIDISLELLVNHEYQTRLVFSIHLHCPLISPGYYVIIYNDPSQVYNTHVRTLILAAINIRRETHKFAAFILL